MSEHRERWSSRPAFVMAAIGSAVGLGNVWRFPYIAAEGGGGAFLIPYFVALITAGIPMMILEYGIGQYMQGSAPKAFRQIKKPFEWIGWWALMIGLVISFYYVVIMAWSWDYLYYSIKSLYAPEVMNEWGSNAKGFFEGVIEKSDGVYNMGILSWPVVIGLGLTWLCIFFIIRKGVKRVGKVVMITVPLPIVLIGIMVVHGLTLKGAGAGIDYYLKPNFAKLADAKVWLLAYGQIFFSLSLGWGILIAYASYMPKKSDVTNNAFITSFANCGTSFFAGFAVFSVLGYMAQMNGVPVEAVAKSGIGLAFETYPTALAQIGGLTGAIIAILFFVTLLSLGIDSAFSIVEAVLSGIEDKFRITKGVATTILCVLGFGVGLFFCTSAGFYWLDIVDNWMCLYGLAVIGLLECLMIGWFWKTKPFKEYINSVSEFKIGWWWDVCIKFITPAILLVSLGYSFHESFTKPYGQNSVNQHARETGLKIESDIEAVAKKLYDCTDKATCQNMINKLDAVELAEKIKSTPGKDGGIPPENLAGTIQKRGKKIADGLTEKDYDKVYLQMAEEDIAVFRKCYVDKGCSGIVKDRTLWAPKIHLAFLKQRLTEKIGAEKVDEVMKANDYPPSSLVIGGWSVAIFVCLLGLVFMLFKWKGGAE